MPLCPYPLSTALGRIKINIWVVPIITDLKTGTYWFPSRREAHESLGDVDNAPQQPSSPPGTASGSATSFTGSRCGGHVGEGEPPNHWAATMPQRARAAQGLGGSKLWQHRTSHRPDTSWWSSPPSSTTRTLRVNMVSFSFWRILPFWAPDIQGRDRKGKIQIVVLGRAERR